MARKRDDTPAAASGERKGKPAAAVSFEEAMQRLEEAVHRLEDGTLGLEESLQAFEEGIAWSRQCHQRLADAERKVEMLLKTDKEELTQVAFDLEDEGEEG
jgi:exodeoxyribonuclease VII small subunit